MRRRQHGMSMVGTLFIAVLLVVLAVITMKLVPVYLEYFTVKRIVSAISKDGGFKEMSPEEIRKAFDKRAQIDNVKAVTGKELQVSKQGERPVINVEYGVKVPLVGNMSAYVDFAASSGE